MLQNLLSGFDPRSYDTGVQRFFWYAIPLFSGLALFSLLYNLYLTRLSYQEDFIGQVAGVFPLASGLCAIPTGLLSDRIGRGPFLVAAALILGVSQLGLCLAQQPRFLLALSFGGGVAGAFIFVNFTPFLAERTAPERRTQAVALWLSIQVMTRMVISLGGGALPRLMGYLTDTSTDLPEPFRYALFLGAACSFLSVIPLLGAGLGSPAPGERRQADDDRDERLAPGPTARRDRGASDDLPHGATKEVAPPAPDPVPWPSLLTFGTITGFRGLAAGLSLPFFNVFFQERLFASAAAIGLIFFLTQGVGLVSTVSAPALGRRLGPTLAIVPVRVSGSLFLALLGWMLDLHLAVLVFAAVAAAEALATPIEITFTTTRVSPTYWARLQSARVTGYQILSGLGSLVAGPLILHWGYGISFALAGACNLASAAIFLAVFGVRKAGRGG